jgi:hypothetical protein
MNMFKRATLASILGWGVLSGLAVAQGLPRGGMPGGLDEIVVVRVWPTANRCSVLDRSTTCSRVPDVLLRNSQVSRDTAIHVYPEGKDQDTMIRASQVATDLRAAGFHRVTTVTHQPGQ